MNKTTNLGNKEHAEKRCKDVINKLKKLSSKETQPVSVEGQARGFFNGSVSILMVRKPLAIVITVLSAYIVPALPVQAAINVPTDTAASPLCIKGKCATPFTAKMLMFEEFGLQPFPNSPSSLTSGLPTVADCQSMPNGVALDTFLKEDIHPLPTEEANESLPNAWDAKVKSCAGLAANSNTVVEGRPPGIWFAHQRWAEFPIQTYFQTAMTGARVNGGLRDRYQLHHYNIGEFGRGGLYYPARGTTKGTQVKLHPNLPVQNPSSVWTFDGTFPPKLLMARYGEVILFRHYNALPIDVAANGGFGIHTLTTHEHNGHNGAESDGYTQAHFLPGEFYDYHWPMILAGHNTIFDPKAGAPDGNGGINPVNGDSRETMSTHWFHDHMLDFTAQNVYKGNAAMMNYYSAIDRGREPKELREASLDPAKPGYGCHYANPDNVNLCLPSGSGMDWGNRDYDVNLLVADKAWDKNGQLKFNIFNTDGFLGDRVTVNWLYKPYLDVFARRYRFRILNASVSRYYKIAIVDEAGNKIPYHMIANDGNIMEHAIPFPNVQAPESSPELGIAERYDIVVDFNGMAGKKIYFVNVLEHENGRGPSRAIPLASVLNGTYVAIDGSPGDPGVGKFLELRVQNYAGTDLSMNPVAYQPPDYPPPADYVGPANLKMIPLPSFSTNELKTAVNRTFVFGRSDGTDTKPWTIKTDGGTGFNMDPHRLSAAPQIGKAEIWHLKGSSGWTHPVHIHFEEGQILYRGDQPPPIWEKYARKDVYRIGPLSDSKLTVDLAIRFREFAGTYMEHCHNTQHEDTAMLLRWDIQYPGQTLAIPTPQSTWEGGFYDPPSSTIQLPTAKSGDVKAKAAFVLPPQ